MADYEILTSDDSRRWHDYLSMLPAEQQDVYYTPEYYKLYEANGDGVAKCFVFKKDRDIALYPFLLNRINDLGYELDDEYFDIQGAYGYNGVGAYGYNGVISTGMIDRFQAELVMALHEYTQQHNVVTEFIRINPLIASKFKYSDYFCLSKISTIYFTNLEAGNILYDEYEHSTRKNIKKAQREGLQVKSNKGIENDKSFRQIFIDIYCSTMDRHKADDFYYFTDEYFLNLTSQLSGCSRIYVAFIENRAISSELVLFDRTRSYSFLGGTLPEWFSYRPNDLLKHTIINDMKSEGLRYFILGGGSQDGDGISRYKKSFGKTNATDFSIGTKIHNQRVYDRLLEQWKEKHPISAAKYGHMLQGYRKLDA